MTEFALLLLNLFCVSFSSPFSTKKCLDLLVKNPPLRRVFFSSFSFQRVLLFHMSNKSMGLATNDILSGLESTTMAES